MGIKCLQCGASKVQLQGRPVPRLQPAFGRPELIEVTVYHWACEACGNRFQTISRRLPIAGSSKSWKEKMI